MDQVVTNLLQSINNPALALLQWDDVFSVAEVLSHKKRSPTQAMSIASTVQLYLAE